MNMPVTNNEIVMKPGTILVTRTDLNGVITFANDSFVEISGFARHELIGENHNIVRHPDMPVAAYEEMWSTLKKGNPWHRVIKNRTKSGDFYWVSANVKPLIEDGKAVGYMSVRHEPTRAQIAEADALYRQINANQAQLQTKGLSALIKKIKELAPWQQLTFASAFFVIPNFYLMYSLFETANNGLLATVALSTLVGMLVITKFCQALHHSLDISIQRLNQLVLNQFNQSLDLRLDSQIGDLYRAIYATSIKLGDDLAQAQQANAESLRIIRGLETVQSSVLVTNSNFDIIFVNKSASTLFHKAEADIRKELPHFNSKTLLGSNIDLFHKNPSFQRNALANLKDGVTSKLVIADRTMQVTAKPVIAENGERIGYVAEWQDKTVEVKIEAEIQALVNSVKAGDLSARIQLENKEGFMKSLSVNINELTDVIENVFRDINTLIEQMANGDLTNSIHADYQGIYAQCRDNINDAIAKISQFIVEIRETADFVNDSSQEMASGNNNLSHRVEQQAASLEETAASMHELSSTVKSNADNTNEAAKVVQSATQLAAKGGDVVKSAISAMQEINESSNKIAEIISVIDEIAFQTNLLALNASVEAARAGEQGRGFSVVATEVRNLAQRSANAAQQSSDLIQNSVQKVRAGTAYVNETGAALMEIVDSILQVGEIVSHITASSNEQSAGIGQVNQAIAQMDDITQQNAALAEEAAASSMAMSDQSAKMTQLLSFFKVNGKAPPPKAMPIQQSSSKLVEKAKVAAPSVASPALSDEWEEF
jgi:methyl-accepting chemotaxis protein